MYHNDKSIVQQNNKHPVHIHTKNQTPQKRHHVSWLLK